MSGTDRDRLGAGDDEGRLRVVAALAAVVMAAWAICMVCDAGWSGWRAYYSAGVGFSSLVLCGVLVARAFGRERSPALWFLVAVVPLNLAVGRLSLSPLAPNSASLELSTLGFLAVVGTCFLLAFAIMGYFVERRHAPSTRHQSA